MPRFDFNLRWLFTELPMRDRFAAAARAGFKGVESVQIQDMPAPDLARILADADLTLVQILAPSDWDQGLRGLACLPDRVADARRGVEVAVEYALQTGKPAIHVLAGNVPEGEDRERCREVYLRNLDHAAEVADAAGLTVVIEPICRARFPDFLLNRLEEARQVIDAVGKANIKILFDTYHVQMEEGSVCEPLERYFPYVGHIQIGDSPGRNEPGVGELPFPAIFETIERLNYRGWIGCEYTPSTSTLESLAWGAPYGLGGNGA